MSFIARKAVVRNDTHGTAAVIEADAANARAIELSGSPCMAVAFNPLA